ncbi:MAG: tyrosine-type recombinase/integrase [Burkholderiaceae bacterium]|nr:tyrosine-type recombinase/integrase [Burkholderiaceae bacterium]
MPVQKLSDEIVASLTCPVGRTHIEYFDTVMRGLYVDVLANERMAFRVRYRQDGKKRAHTLGNARVLTVAEARDQARMALRKVMAGGDPKATDLPDGGLTIGHFYTQQYLPYVKSYKRSWDTDESMIRNHLLPALGDRAMGSLIPPEIARLVESMRTRDYAEGTINRMLVLLRYGYTLALRWRLDGVDSNPAKELQNLKEDNKIERFLSPEQTTQLLTAVRGSQNPLLAFIVAFLLFTGARKREVLDAKWQDIDWRQKLWRIPKTKSGKVRHVPLSSGALKLLSALQEKVDMKIDHIFANPRTGLPFVSIFYSWDTARTEAGLPELRIHDLRHSFASFLVNAGRSLYEVQELLGHSDIRTTSRYAHLSRERLREAVEVVQME